MLQSRKKKVQSRKNLYRDTLLVLIYLHKPPCRRVYSHMISHIQRFLMFLRWSPNRIVSSERTASNSSKIANNRDTKPWHLTISHIKESQHCNYLIIRLGKNLENNMNEITPNILYCSVLKKKYWNTYIPTYPYDNFLP